MRRWRLVVDKARNVLAVNVRQHLAKIPPSCRQMHRTPGIAVMVGLGLSDAVGIAAGVAGKFSPHDYSSSGSRMSP
jgi:hypothetical protein